MTLSRLYAIVFGVVYTAVGLVGMAVSSSLAVGTLLIFQVNLVHNLIHLVVGLAGIAAFASGRQVLYCRVMAVVFALVAVAGFLPQPLLGVVPIGGFDILLHAATAVLAGIAGWAYAGGMRRSAA